MRGWRGIGGNSMFISAFGNAKGFHHTIEKISIKKGNTLQTAASQPHGGIALEKEIWKKAATSFDMSRHANAPELVADSKSLSAANIQQIEFIT